ncbi:hypothetical protein FB45DRAFT_248762 [Roridomyces roridus]|uniref:Zn(2)-C6 fungal-type domain-containing protein n=1 Tax=Roridomyces roridus TaxID=1738132 RepID=A0AAD7FBZ7_9AGAR|nr:hypothetical protein FB45DRAFT_248762 [Roridomyces roridus]
MSSGSSAGKQPLRRGKACLNCRHLKIKCDGVRPVCGQCQRVPKDDECEVLETKSRTQDLENTILQLQSRIEELQSNTCSVLYPGQQIYPKANSSDSDSSQSSDQSYQGFKEPSRDMIQSLIHHFLPHASELGFFIHPGRFLEAALLPLPFGHERRPSPALLCVVYLWGVHLSQAPDEPIFLKLAKEYISIEIGAHRAIHTMQAHVLLATYLLRNTHFLEAEFYANGAAVLALGYKLHKVRTSRPGVDGSPELSGLCGSPDAVQEGERIRGFWAAATLQSNIHILLESANRALCILETKGCEIDTPWPLEIAEYEAGALSSEYRGQESLRQFLTAEPPPVPWATSSSSTTTSMCTLEAQASVLLFRAARLAGAWTPDLQPHELQSHISSHTWLDARITQLWAFLPSDLSGPTFLATHTLTAAAAIKLHSSPGMTAQQTTCVAAARALISCLRSSASSSSMPPLIPTPRVGPPIVGALAFLACRILLDEVGRSRAFRAVWAELGVGVEDAEAAGEEVELREGMGVMSAWGEGDPLVGYYLGKLGREYEAM